MKDKSRILTDGKMEDIFQASHRDNGRKEIFREIALAQDEISYKAGYEQAKAEK